MSLMRILVSYGHKTEIWEMSRITLTQLLKDEPVFVLCLHKSQYLLGNNSFV